MPAIGNIDELVDTIGFSSFETLVRVRGGRRLYVPTDVESAAQIVQWLGEDKAVRLIESYGGFSIDIPNRRPATLPSRRAMIEALVDAGKSDAEIVEVVGCTERAVRGYRREMREALPASNLRQAS
jgi:DNA-binding NarL/FixJ family response regulator